MEFFDRRLRYTILPVYLYHRSSVIKCMGSRVHQQVIFLPVQALHSWILGLLLWDYCMVQKHHKLPCVLRTLGNVMECCSQVSQHGCHFSKPVPLPLGQCASSNIVGTSKICPVAHYTFWPGSEITNDLLCIPVNILKIG